MVTRTGGAFDYYDDAGVFMDEIGCLVLTRWLDDDEEPTHIAVYRPEAWSFWRFA